MGADEEIRKCRWARASATAVLHESLACQKCRIERDWLAGKLVVRKSGLEILDTLEVNRDFAVDDRIDDESRGFGRFRQRGGGPLQPVGILGKDVEDHVA